MNELIDCKIRKELIINIWMLIKSVLKAGHRRLIVVILQLGRLEPELFYVA
jgi:hypothetical protein